MELTLNGNNLYRNGAIIKFSDLEYQLLREKINVVPDIEDKYHTVVQGDRIDLLAYKYYKNIVPDSSKYWWIIADANDIYNPLDLSDMVGQQLLIPNISRILLELQ